MIIGRQLHSPPRAKTWATAPQVDDDIEHAARRHPHQFALRFLDLKMQTAQGPLARAAMIILHEGRGYAGGGEFFGLPGFQKESARIAKDLRLDQHRILDRGTLKLHLSGVTLVRVL